MNPFGAIALVSALVQKLHVDAHLSSDVIPWGSPIPVFGDPAVSRVATLGINPSNREFTSNDGEELSGASRRFHSLKSLGIQEWNEANDRHLEMIYISCRDYFLKNPYDSWFGQLNVIIEKTAASFYGDSQIQACHLDLVPYATKEKWGSLPKHTQHRLLSAGGRFLADIITNSRVELVILNGSSVVSEFERMSGTSLTRMDMPTWRLRRGGRISVPGFAFSGVISSVSGVELGRQIKVLGYNHNIQSSFGVTNLVRKSISEWIGNEFMKGNYAQA